MLGIPDHVQREGGEVRIPGLAPDGQTGLGQGDRLRVLALRPGNHAEAGEAMAAEGIRRRRGVDQRPFQPLPALLEMHPQVPEGRQRPG